MNEEPIQTTVSVIPMRRLINVIFVSCLAIIGVLVICDYVFNYLDVFDERGIRRIWNIAREQSLPTWFSSMLAQLLGVTVLLIALVQRSSVTRLHTTAWVLIGLFFLWIGIDDFAEIHEKLGGVLKRLAAKGEEAAVTEFLLQNPSFSWHTFIAPFFAACGLAIFAFLGLAFWRLRLLHYLILGFGCWVVAQGLDFVEGLNNVERLYRSVQDTFRVELIYGVTHTFKVIEEVLEMLGTTLLWVGFLHYFAHVSNGLQFSLEYQDSR